MRRRSVLVFREFESTHGRDFYEIEGWISRTLDARSLVPLQVSVAVAPGDEESGPWAGRRMLVIAVLAEEVLHEAA